MNLNYILQKIPNFRPASLHALRKKSDGFTLLEVLIALVILAIALGAIIKTVNSNTRNFTYLRNRTVAHWVAMYTASAIELGFPSYTPVPPEQETTGNIEMFNKQWDWHAKFSPTPDASVTKITIDITDPTSHEIAASVISYKAKGAS